VGSGARVPAVEPEAMSQTGRIDEARATLEAAGLREGLLHLLSILLAPRATLAEDGRFSACRECAMPEMEKILRRAEEHWAEPRRPGQPQPEAAPAAAPEDRKPAP